MRPVLRLQREARCAEAEHLLRPRGLERVDRAAQIRLEDFRRIEPAGVVPEIVAGDLVAVGGDARDDVRAFLRDDAGGEEGQARAAELVQAEILDRRVAAPERVLAQGPVLGMANSRLKSCAMSSKSMLSQAFTAAASRPLRPPCPVAEEAADGEQVHVRAQPCGDGLGRRVHDRLLDVEGGVEQYRHPGRRPEGADQTVIERVGLRAPRCARARCRRHG